MTEGEETICRVEKVFFLFAVKRARIMLRLLQHGATEMTKQNTCLSSTQSAPPLNVCPCFAPEFYTSCPLLALRNSCNLVRYTHPVLKFILPSLHTRRVPNFRSTCPNALHSCARTLQVPRPEPITMNFSAALKRSASSFFFTNTDSGFCAHMTGHTKDLNQT